MNRIRSVADSFFGAALNPSGRPHKNPVPDDILAHVAPLGWEHIALTGDYVWSAVKPEPGFRPLRDVHAAFLPLAA